MPGKESGTYCIILLAILGGLVVVFLKFQSEWRRYNHPPGADYVYWSNTLKYGVVKQDTWVVTTEIESIRKVHGRDIVTKCINRSHEKIRTALHFAAEKGNMEIARILVENGANITALDIYGFTPPCLARILGNNDVAEYLENIGKVTDCNAREDSASLQEDKESIRRKLFAKLESMRIFREARHLSLAVRAILDASRTLNVYNTTNNDGLSVLEVLLDASGSIDNVYPCDAAYHGESLQLMEVLFGNDARIPQDVNNHLAVIAWQILLMNKNTDMLRRVLWVVDPNYTVCHRELEECDDDESWFLEPVCQTVLERTILWSDLELFSGNHIDLLRHLLVQTPANASERHTGNSIGHMLVDRGYRDPFLRLFAFPDMQEHLKHWSAMTNKNGEPLIYFLYAKTVLDNTTKEILAWLLQHGADIDMASTAKNGTVLHWAVETGSIEAVSHLLTVEKANSNAIDRDGNGPLHYACRDTDFTRNHKPKNTKIINMLLDAGANKTLANNDGYTPYDLALYDYQEKLTAIWPK